MTNVIIVEGRVTGKMNVGTLKNLDIQGKKEITVVPRLRAHQAVVTAPHPPPEAALQAVAVKANPRAARKLKRRRARKVEKQEKRIKKIKKIKRKAPGQGQDQNLSLNQIKNQKV